MDMKTPTMNGTLDETMMATAISELYGRRGDPGYITPSFANKPGSVSDIALGTLDGSYLLITDGVSGKETTFMLLDPEHAGYFPNTKNPFDLIASGPTWYGHDCGDGNVLFFPRGTLERKIGGADIAQGALHMLGKEALQQRYAQKTS